MYYVWIYLLLYYLPPYVKREREQQKSQKDKYSQETFKYIKYPYYYFITYPHMLREREHDTTLIMSKNREITLIKVYLRTRHKLRSVYYYVIFYH